MPHEVVAEVVRSELVEGRHRGSVIALDGDGNIALSLGEPELPMYPRSANKPLQAAAMLRCGLDLEGELLALAAASHSGEEFHLDGVRRILGHVGLTDDALQTPAEWPLDELARIAYARQGFEPTPIAMNCSGKHAAMLATCAAQGWPTDTYLDPAHPLQTAIHDHIVKLAGEPVAHTGVDGCGAPLYSITLVGLARAFRWLALAEPGSPERQVVEAIQTYPEFTSGTTRDEARLIRALPGLFGKAGAEGVYAVAFDDGRTIALKIEDGASRARLVVMAAALRHLGVDHPVLDEVGTFVVTGGGRPVGEIRATF